MSSATADQNPTRSPADQSRSARATECDVVLQGGTASGVIYPRALVTLARRYRLRGIGGTSAGAMAAAVAAAAELGRSTGKGGFGTIAGVPEELGGGRLMRLFQPTPRTRALFDLALVLTGGDRPEGRTTLSKIIGGLAAAIKGYPLAAGGGLMPGLVVLLIGVASGQPWTMLFGLVLMVIIELIALLAAIMINLSRDVPANDFGICTGLTEPGSEAALIDWLSAKIKLAAGVDEDAPPLTFGQLWLGRHDASDADAEQLAEAAEDAAARQVDLRVITTCLSEGRPYELPFSASRFFYDPQEWGRIFPESVMQALAAASEPAPPADVDPQLWLDDQVRALEQEHGLRRLPAAADLPLVVAVRMSLSMPLMISAVPLWVVERMDTGADPRLDPAGPARFVKVWFSDGGLSQNFPVQLFDASLPTRPTYAINLQSFPRGSEPEEEDPPLEATVEWAHGNRDGLAPKIARWPSRGLSAIAGFLGAVYTSSASWQYTTQLTYPGFRDRIVRVLQTPREGGINLAMDDDTIDRLARRGEFAAQAIADQFDLPHFPPMQDGRPTSTGWENHRWVRYRALLSVLPSWAQSYGAGRPAVDPLIEQPPSFPFRTAGQQELADELDQAMARLAQVVADADPEDLAALTSAPRPVGVLRRMPQI